MGKFSRLGNDLYEGRVSIDFVGRKWLWYAISAVIIGDLGLRPDRPGASTWASSSPAARSTASPCRPTRSPRTPPTSCARTVAGHRRRGGRVAGRDDLGQRGDPDPDRGAHRRTRAPRSSTPSSSRPEPRPTTSPSPSSAPAGDARSPSDQLIGLVVFLVLVVLFIWAYFREWKMSVAALVALAHDVVITIGIYSLSGFEVTPATVTGLLTILGLLALRHGRRLRQGPREHQEPPHSRG